MDKATQVHVDQIIAGLKTISQGYIGDCLKPETLENMRVAFENLLKYLYQLQIQTSLS
jgi:hypothetical protein